MLNVLLTGVGGQGTVLASKVLAQAAQDKGWHVRTAETIGMAQRGGSVVSHVRMGNAGEEVYSPLISEGGADMIIAFEPAEGARVLPYLAPHGLLVTATTGIPAVASVLGKTPYRGAQMIAQLVDVFAEMPERLVIVPDAAILKRMGNRRALNTVLLASAISIGYLPLTIDDLVGAIEGCVKPELIDMNLRAIELTLE